MMQIEDWIKGKRVLLLGFGREGQSTYRLLRKLGGWKELAVADRAERRELAAADQAERQKPAAADQAEKGEFPEKIRWISGPDYQKAMDAYDVVFKSPGIVLERPIETYACRILSQMEVFFRLYRDRIIGITGSKGKSTTTSLLYHILKTAGRKVILAGNIGIPVFDCMDEVDEDTEIIVELSCHQLEYMTVSPHIAILLNIYEEHLDHYGTMENYVRAKEKIYRHQQPEDLFICGEQCLPDKNSCPSRLIPVIDLGNERKSAEINADSSVCLSGDCISWKGQAYRVPLSDIRLLGHHNCYDIAFVYAACRLKGISNEEFTRGLTTYQPLPHRLAFLGEKDGVRYYDDSISTICEAAIQALNTLADADTVLIGGMDRRIDYRDLIEYLSESTVEHIILMEATGKRIFGEINEKYPAFERKERIIVVDHLEEAVQTAKKVTRPGRSCVLSPAAASYGIFKNFEERGDVFRELIFGDA